MNAVALPLRTLQGILYGLLLLAFCGAALGAPRATVQVGDGPLYAGVPFVVQVVTEDFDNEPQPEITVPEDSQLELEFVGANQNHSSRVEIINGRINQWSTTNYVFRYRATAPAQGRFRLGAFKVTQNGKSAATRPLSIAVGQLAATDEQAIRLVLPPGKLWLHQPVEVAVQWWLSDELAARQGGYDISVPLFGQTDFFRFEEVDIPGASTVVDIHTGANPLQLPVTIRSAGRRGKEGRLVSMRRKMIPIRMGEVSVAPSSVTVKEVYSSGGFFSRPAVRRLQRAVGKARTLIIRGTPRTARPANFAGVVGRGITIAVSAAHTVVQVGDPIELTVTLSGDTQTGALTLPPFAALGLPAPDFRTPAGPVTGKVAGNAKHFTFEIRAEHAAVQEIPPLSVSWFSPDSERFEKAASKPVALSVKPANIVSAEDVESTAAAVKPAQAGPTKAKAPAADTAAGSTSKGLASTGLAGAELAIETNLERLLDTPAPAIFNQQIIVGIYAFGIVLTAASAGWSRRQRRDPAAVKAAADLRKIRAAINSARTHSELLNALRLLPPSGLPFNRAAYDKLVRQCENEVYASAEGGTSTIAGSAADEARQFAGQLGQ